MLEGIEIGLERDLLGWVREPPIAKPHLVTVAPGLPVIPEIIAQQEMLDPDASTPLIYAGCMSGTHEIAQGLMQAVRHPNERELAGTQQPGQRCRITGVILDSVPRLARRERWSADTGSESEFSQLSLNIIATASRLIHKLSTPMSS